MKEEKERGRRSTIRGRRAVSKIYDQWTKTIKDRLLSRGGEGELGNAKEKRKKKRLRLSCDMGPQHEEQGSLLRKGKTDLSRK